MWPSGRLHDNSSQLHLIALKFCIQNCLINISVEFEDENDPSRNDWVIKKIVIIDQTIPEGGYRDFFSQKLFSQNYLKHIWIDSVFNVDSEYNISFEPNSSFLTKHCLKKVSNCLDMSQMTSGFGVSQMPGFVASKKDYRMVKTRTQ